MNTDILKHRDAEFDIQQASIFNALSTNAVAWGIPAARTRIVPRPFDESARRNLPGSIYTNWLKHTNRLYKISPTIWIEVEMTKREYESDRKDEHFKLHVIARSLGQQWGRRDEAICLHYS